MKKKKKQSRRRSRKDATAQEEERGESADGAKGTEASRRVISGAECYRRIQSGADRKHTRLWETAGHQNLIEESDQGGKQES